MVRPFDVSKFRTSLTKSIQGISVGFESDPTDWIDTGNYCLNYLISGDFNNGIPLGRVTMLAGESGSGKSLVGSGNLVANAQKKGIFCIVMDSENALHEDWLKALGVDTSPEKLMRINVSMVDDVAKIISDFIITYKKDYVDKPDKPKILFVVDSLGMLLTPTDRAQFEKGEMKGDLGRKAKSLTALIRNTVNLIGSLNIGLVATNHTYASQDMFDPDDKISGGQGFMYASSIVIAMKKLKLKEDEEGNKITDVTGIRSACKVMKSRFNKPFEAVQVKIPYEAGMDPYSGLIELFEKKNILVKQGNRLKYVDRFGKEHLHYRKQWTSEQLDLIMAEFTDTVTDDSQNINKIKQPLGAIIDDESVGGSDAT